MLWFSCDNKNAGVGKGSIVLLGNSAERDHLLQLARVSRLIFEGIKWKSSFCDLGFSGRTASWSLWERLLQSCGSVELVDQKMKIVLLFQGHPKTLKS